jgi:hypothetical protein
LTTKRVKIDNINEYSDNLINASISGNASTATTAGTCTGNSATATKLATARTINGVSFDGTANINIIESGSNSNGYYTKFADGTMMCYRIVPLNLTVNNNADTTIVSQTFPVSFIARPIFVGTMSGYAANRFTICCDNNESTYSVIAYCNTGTWVLSGSTNFIMFAIGKWK